MTSDSSGLLGELTRHVKAMLDDIGRASTTTVSPEVSQPWGHIPAYYQLDERLSLGDVGATALEQAVDLCLGVPRVQAVATRGEVHKVLVGPLVRAHEDQRHPSAVAEEIGRAHV